MPDKKHPRIVISTPEGMKKKWAEIMNDTHISLKRKMALVASDMDFARDIEDAFSKHISATAGEEQAVLLEALKYWERDHFASLVAEVAQATGADPAQIANKDTRTPEQQQALLEASARRQIARMDRFFNSNYMTVSEILQNTHSVFDPDPANPEPNVDADNTDTWGFKESFLWYYFTTRPDLRPSDPNAITDEDKKQLIDTFKRFDAFIADYFGDIDAAKHCDTDSKEDNEYRKAFEAFISAERPADAEEIINLLPVVRSLKIDSINFPVDKINKYVWGLLEEYANGQIKLHVEKHGSKDPVYIYYSIDFDELEKRGLSITKKLSYYEKRLYIAAGAVFAIKGEEPFTYADLYRAMGYEGTPGGNDIEKMDNAITKMGGAHIFIDNVEEQNAKYNYPHFRYDGALLPVERISAITPEGKTTDAAIHLFREPPLISFARGRGQITTFSICVLQSPISKTESTIALEDYLIERIAQARSVLKKIEKRRCSTDEQRNDKALAIKKANNPRIRLETLYDHAGIKTKMQRKRATEKLKTILEHQKKVQFIKDFELDRDNITITL